MNSVAIARDEKELYYLPVSMISPNPYQPRRQFDPMQLVELAQSIKQHGVMQPINVRMMDGGYELVSGERRLRATILADIDTIPAIIIDITDRESALLAMVENLQRADLNYLEEAEGYAAILTEMNMTQEDLAKKVGKNQSTVANKLRLLRLSRNVKRMLLEHNLSERHARALLRIDKDQGATIAEDMHIQVIERIVRDDLTVKKTEELIDRIINKPKQGAINKPKTYIRDLRIFTNTIKHALGVVKDSGMKAEYEIDEGTEGCFITIAVSYQ